MELEYADFATLEAMAKQVMARQFFGVSGRTAFSQIARGGGCNEALATRADGHGDHVFGQALFIAHAGVIPASVDVDKGVVHDDFDTDPWIKAQKTRQQVG